MTLKRLSYRSLRNPGLTDESLLRTIIAPAYTRNRVEGVTGCLYCGRYSFVQIIEGEEEAVRSLMARIAADTRHREVVVFSSTTAGARLFADWNLKWVRGKDCVTVERLSEAAMLVLPPKPVSPPVFADHMQPAGTADVSLNRPADTLTRRIIGELVVAEPTIY